MGYSFHHFSPLFFWHTDTLALAAPFGFDLSDYLTFA
jgi:hypothetical protein